MHKGALDKVRMERHFVDSVDTVILGFGFTSSLFLPLWIVELTSLVPTKISNIIYSRDLAIEAIFFALGAWLMMVALRFGTHLEIRMRNAKESPRRMVLIIILGGASLFMYRQFADYMLSTIKDSWSEDDRYIYLIECLRGWIIWWSILLGYIGKTPWDRGKRLLQSPHDKGDGKAPSVLGIWTRSYCIIVSLIAFIQISYVNALVRPDPSMIRAAAVISIYKKCPIIKNSVMPLLADGKINNEEKDVVITIIQNARASVGIRNCPYNPRALN